MYTEESMQAELEREMDGCDGDDSVSERYHDELDGLDDWGPDEDAPDRDGDFDEDDVLGPLFDDDLPF